jgi:hypothetical protein
MTGVTCTGCGAHVTVRGLTQCPICRIPMRPILDERIKVASLAPPRFDDPIKSTAPASPRPRTAYRLGAKDWFAIITLSVLAVLIGLIVYGVVVPSESKLRDRAVSSALYRCQLAIQSIARYGASDIPPFTKNYGKGDEFYFAWPRGSFEFSNAFGAREKMSASCNGILSTGEINSLTVNGKDLL